MHALRGEVLARRIHVFGRHAKARALLHRLGVVEAFLHRDHHAAAGDAEVHRLVKSVTAVLDQHIAPRDAQVGAAVLYVCGCIARAHHDQPQIATVGADDQLARGFGVFPRPDTDAREQRSGLVEDPPLRQRNADARHVQPSGCRPLMRPQEAD